MSSFPSRYDPRGGALKATGAREGVLRKLSGTSRAGYPSKMRSTLAYLLPAFALAGCSHEMIANKHTTFSLPRAIETKITFEPLDRERAQSYLEVERQMYKKYTDPMIERREGLARGRDERYREVRHEFPECDRQGHCLQHVSKGDVRKFERFNDLTREINAYDTEIVELDTAIRDWKSRLELRTRAILNRFLVHEMLQLPSIERHFQGVLAYSLESFETRRQLSLHLMRFAPNDEDLEPQLLGDYDFRMLGRPIDEAAVITTFEVFLMPPLNQLGQPTRYLVTMLVNTHQLDLRFYDKDFLRSWAAKLVEPFQDELRKDAYCGLYSVAGETLAPRLGLDQPRLCAGARNLMRSLDAAKFPDRFAPDRWLVPLAYYPFPKKN